MRQNFSDETDFTLLSPEGKNWLLKSAELAADTDLMEVSLITVYEYRRFENGEMILDSSSVEQVQTIVMEEM